MAVSKLASKLQDISYSNGTTVSVPNNSVTTWDIYTVPVDGILICQASIMFASNSTGYREFRAGINSNIGADIAVRANVDTYTKLCVPVVRRVKVGEKVQFTAIQNSGSALNVISRKLQGVLLTI